MKTYAQPILLASALLWSCSRPQHRHLDYYEAKIIHSDLRQSILSIQSAEAMGELGFEPSIASLPNFQKSNLDAVTSGSVRRILVYDYPSRGTSVEFNYRDNRFTPAEIEAGFGQYQPKLYLSESYSVEEFFMKFDRFPLKISPNGGLRQSYSQVPSNEVLEDLTGTLTVSVHHDGLIEYVHLHVEKGQLAGLSLTPNEELD